MQTIFPIFETNSTNTVANKKKKNRMDFRNAEEAEPFNEASVKS